MTEEEICHKCGKKRKKEDNYCSHCAFPLYRASEKIEYYKSKIEKRRCDLERESANLNNQLIALVTLFAGLIVIFLPFLYQLDLVQDWDIFKLFIIDFFLLGILFFFIYLLISKKVSHRADQLNQHFEDDVVKIGEIALIPDKELDEYRRTKR